MKTKVLLSTTVLFFALSSPALADSKSRSCPPPSHQQTQGIAASNEPDSRHANQSGKPIIYTDVDKFLTEVRSPVGRKVQVTGPIEPALVLADCTLKGCPFPPDAKLGDQLLCNNCHFPIRLAGRQGNGILLRGIGCPAREVVVYQGKGGQATFLVVKSCDSDIKLEKTYTGTGVVRQWPGGVGPANTSDVYIDEVSAVKLSK